MSFGGSSPGKRSFIICAADFCILGITCVVIGLLNPEDDGEQERKRAVERFIEGINKLDPPEWVLWLFGRESFARWLIDLVVAIADVASDLDFTESAKPAGSGSQKS